jgi:Protein of unknown function (DUF3105)
VTRRCSPQGLQLSHANPKSGCPQVLLLLLACKADPTSDACNTCDGDCLVEFIPAESTQHVADPVDYTDRPPTSGDHNACWAEWGVHTEAVPDDNWVHNLEHGGLVFLYNCPDGCEAEVAELTSLVLSFDAGRALLTPYAEMEWKFAAVAWQNRMLTSCVDVDAFRSFFDENVANAPENTPSEPTSCMDTGTSE